MNKALIIKDKLDVLYNDVLNGRQDVFDEIDKMIIDITQLRNLSVQNQEEKSFIEELIVSFIEKSNSIYEILNVRQDNLLTIEHLLEEFHILEIQKFNIENNYVMGLVRISDINQFKERLFHFRKLLYAITISDSNLLEVAKMKSKIQHFNTEILEDEDILRQAYENSN